jgi:hypothetical protein
MKFLLGLVAGAVIGCGVTVWAFEEETHHDHRHVGLRSA